MHHSKLYFISILLWICVNPLYAQLPDNWYSYHSSEKDLYGFKDAKGNIKIPARFNTLTRASVFRNIIAVTEGSNGKSYYLLKNMQKVAKDSLYVWDMSYDCEQESKIRFRDPVTDKVGFLGKNGKVVIPAIYNDARPFYNGFALVIHNRKRICGDGTPYKADSCEHWSWDGTTAMIDSNGIKVADSLNIIATENLNWYSFKIADYPADTALYTSFKAENSKYYSFINYEKEFKYWLYQNFLPGLQNQSLSSYCFNEITVEGLWKQTLRKQFNKADFVKQYSLSLQKKMSAINQRKIETTIFSEGLNLFIYNSKKYTAFYTDCGEPNTARYPLFNVITSHYNSQHKLSYQEHFSFLRTAGGYKLIAVAWNNR